MLQICGVYRAGLWSLETAEMRVAAAKKATEAMKARRTKEATR